MTTSETAESIAAKLRELLARSHDLMMAEVLERYADKVEMIHEPTQPNDGVYDNAELRALTGEEGPAFREILPDIRLDGPITATGNDITTDLTLTGTLPDGTSLRMRVEHTYTVKDGRFVRVATRHHHSEAGEALRSALLSSGDGGEAMRNALQSSRALPKPD